MKKLRCKISLKWNTFWTPKSFNIIRQLHLNCAASYSTKANVTCNSLIKRVLFTCQGDISSCSNIFLKTRTTVILQFLKISNKYFYHFFAFVRSLYILYSQYSDIMQLRGPLGFCPLCIDTFQKKLLENIWGDWCLQFACLVQSSASKWRILLFMGGFCEAFGTSTDNHHVRKGDAFVSPCKYTWIISKKQKRNLLLNLQKIYFC